MSKIIVTGGAGFIGSHIVKELVSRKFDVHVIDNLFSGKKENVPEGATLHVVDIRHLDQIEPIFENAKYVFHLAAIPMVQLSIDDPVLTEEVNVRGTLNILLASKNAHVEKVIFSSSGAIYGDQTTMPLVENLSPMPKSPYALHKHVGEEYMKLFSEVYGLPTVSLRYFNVYGEGQSIEGSYPLVIAKFLDLKAKGKTLTITGDGKQTRDFIHVGDIVIANIKAAESHTVGKGEIINVGSGAETTVNTIAELIGGEVEFIPPRLEPRNSLADISLAKKLLDWEPTIKLEDGLKGLLR